jgi:hypothetical protein
LYGSSIFVKCSEAQARLAKSASSIRSSVVTVMSPEQMATLSSTMSMAPPGTARMAPSKPEIRRDSLVVARPKRLHP